MGFTGAAGLAGVRGVNVGVGGTKFWGGTGLRGVTGLMGLIGATGLADGTGVRGANVGGIDSIGLSGTAGAGDGVRGVNVGGTDAIGLIGISGVSGTGTGERGVNVGGIDSIGLMGMAVLGGGAAGMRGVNVGVGGAAGRIGEMGLTGKAGWAGGTGADGRCVNAGGGGATGVDMGILTGSGGGVFRKKCVVAGVAAVGLSRVSAKATPLASAPNGETTSGGGVTVFCSELRVIKAGCRRASTSLRGRTTGSESYSSPMRKRLGAALRNSPKVILTAPSASCGKTFSTEMEMLAWPKFTPPVTDLARRSAGNRSSMGSSGISKSDMLGGAAERTGAAA